LPSANTISRLPDLTLNSGTLAATLPPQSITLFVVPPVSRCDTNRDGVVNSADVQHIANNIVGLIPPNGSEDINRDGSVNVLDVQKLVTVVLGTSVCP
jgi:hypothetical protein